MKTISIRKTQAVKRYIKKNWLHLTRTHQDLLQAAIDPKVMLRAQHHWMVYVPRDENLKNVTDELYQHMSKADFMRIEVRRLPRNVIKASPHGLLYLPHPYVVPGGRFNEMYGWDSYFIVLGLLHDGYIQLAIWTVENLLYEIEHYGKVLNANRTYYLTRSNPPLLPQMILTVYNKTKDKAWLKTTISKINKQYGFWVSLPHLVPSVGLSRYYDYGTTPAPEAAQEYYQQAIKFYQTQLVKAYNASHFYNKKTKQLTGAFYRGDRSVRESGFDLSKKYGPFGADIVSYIPVGLNSLLHRSEECAAEIHAILGNSRQVTIWRNRAERRAKRINRYLWEPDLGFYFDYNFVTKRSRPYIYATMIYPLWAGVATPEQAERIVKNIPILESAGGMMTSGYVTGMQWDAPFGWAPHQLFAVQGLARYGYHHEARRLAEKFVSMINDDFAEHGTLFEKYDMRKRSSQVTDELSYGYRTNVVGFGWTNGVYLELLHYLAQFQS